MKYITAAFYFGIALFFLQPLLGVSIPVPWLELIIGGSAVIIGINQLR